MEWVMIESVVTSVIVGTEYLPLMMERVKQLLSNSLKRSFQLNLRVPTQFNQSVPVEKQLGENIFPNMMTGTFQSTIPGDNWKSPIHGVSEEHAEWSYVTIKGFSIPLRHGWKMCWVYNIQKVKTSTERFVTNTSIMANSLSFLDSTCHVCVWYLAIYRHYVHSTNYWLLFGSVHLMITWCFFLHFLYNHQILFFLLPISTIQWERTLLLCMHYITPPH